MVSPSHSLLATAALVLATSAHALNFTTPLTQCANITLSWRGGQAPYEILLVPVGHLVPEVRTIINYQNIAGANGSEEGTLEFNFPLTFPAGSQFIAVLSDAQYGPGSGGTSDILTVEHGDDASCLGTKQVKPEFYFYLDPPTPTQCNPWEISWPQSVVSSLSTNASADDAISIWAITPGGPSFAVPLPAIPDPAVASRECSAWTVDVKAGTQVMLVAGYESSALANGRGKGGSTDLFSVAYSSEKSCLVDDPPATSAFPSTTPSTFSSTSNTVVAPGPTSSVSGSPQGAEGSSGGARQLVSSSMPLALAVLVGSVVMGAL